MALQGTPRTRTGTVEQISLEARPEWGRDGEVPFKVACRLVLGDGLPVYIDTAAGSFSTAGFKPAGVLPGGHPWAIAGDRDGQGVEGDPILTVWEGDRLVVQAVVGEVRVSKRGNRYASANRARIAQWTRPTWVDGLPPTPTAPAPAPAPTIPPSRRAQDMCPHGVVVWKTGDCELCDPPVPPM